jgi:hypothetical protein
VGGLSKANKYDDASTGSNASFVIRVKIMHGYVKEKVIPRLITVQNKLPNIKHLWEQRVILAIKR